MKAILPAAFCMVPLLGYAGEQTGSSKVNAELDAVRAADDARVAAMISPDREALDASFSNDLRYAHSDGSVDTKTSFIDVLLAGKIDYVGYDYVEREFSFPAQHIALMWGRTRIRSVANGTNLDNVLSFLAVWRNEDGHWRFLAWQSCRVPAQNVEPNSPRSSARRRDRRQPVDTSCLRKSPKEAEVGGEGVWDGTIAVFQNWETTWKRSKICLAVGRLEPMFCEDSAPSDIRIYL